MSFEVDIQHEFLQVHFVSVSTEFYYYLNFGISQVTHTPSTIDRTFSKINDISYIIYNVSYINVGCAPVQVVGGGPFKGRVLPMWFKFQNLAECDDRVWSINQ